MADLSILQNAVASHRFLAPDLLFIILNLSFCRTGIVNQGKCSFPLLPGGGILN